MTKINRSMIVLVLLAVFAMPAAAELFTITLTNGSTFTSRYRPIQSAADEGTLQFLTDTGNWISLEKEIVTSVTAETESRGFGIVIDTQTIALGWDPTSIQQAEESETPEDPTAQLLRYLVEQDRAEAAAPAPAPFSNELIVEPSEAGGIPLWMTGAGTYGANR